MHLTKQRSEKCSKWLIKTEAFFADAFKGENKQHIHFEMMHYHLYNSETSQVPLSMNFSAFQPTV